MENQLTTSEDDMSEASSPRKSGGKLGRKSLDSHCEVERKRREKFQNYILELRNSIPDCQTILCSKNKPNRLTILRLAADHLKALRESLNYPETNPSFLSNQEIKHLILEAAKGFLFVVDCEFGQVVYVTESIQSVLNCNPSDWIGSCIYDKIHLGDVDHLKGQLSTEEARKPQVVLDLKSGLFKKERNPGKLRRNFICRMKTGQGVDKTRGRHIFLSDSNGQEYVFVHCSGYIKRVSKHTNSNNSENLIAIGRLQLGSTPETNPSAEEFISRHSLDGTFSFVDEQVVSVLGYTSVDLLGKPCYEFFHPTERSYLEESFKQVVALKGQMMNVVGRFRAKNSEWILLRMSMYAFTNPWSNATEFIMCTSRLVKNIVVLNGEDAELHVPIGTHGTTQQSNASNQLGPFPQYSNLKIPSALCNARSAIQPFHAEKVNKTILNARLDASSSTQVPYVAEMFEVNKIPCDDKAEDFEDILDILSQEENLELLTCILK